MNECSDSAAESQWFIMEAVVGIDFVLYNNMVKSIIIFEFI